MVTKEQVDKARAAYQVERAKADDAYEAANAVYEAAYEAAYDAAYDAAYATANATANAAFHAAAYEAAGATAYDAAKVAWDKYTELKEEFENGN